MKREFSPVHLALILIMGCVTFRLVSSLFPEYIPNISPLMAIAYVGAMYLPRRWGWLVVPLTLMMTDLAFLQLNYRTDGSGSMFSWWTPISLVIYALAGGLGILISSHKSLGRIASGSVVCSLLFYIAGNTFAWMQNITAKLTPVYSSDLAGWWQANTVGLPGYVPTWLFLRNGVAGDLFFVLLLLLVLDRSVLFGQVQAKSAVRTV